MEANNRKLEKTLSERDGQLREVTSELANAEDRWQQQQVEMKRLVDISAEPLAIERRNQQLVEENEQLKKTVAGAGSGKSPVDQRHQLALVSVWRRHYCVGHFAGPDSTDVESA